MQNEDRKQQSRFVRDFITLMKVTTVSTPPSTGLSMIQFLNSANYNNII